MTKKITYIVMLLLCLLAVFQLYLYTMFPAFKMDDSPETIIAAQTLGISHAPGYPLLSLCAKAFMILPLGSPAVKMNIFASFLAVLVLTVTFVLLRLNLSRFFGYKGIVINVIGILVLAFSFMFWNQAIDAKGGIYILNLLFFSVLFYAFLKLLSEYNLQYLYILSYVYGLALTNHWQSIIVVLPVLGYVFVKYHKKISIKHSIFSFIFLLIGLSAYLYLPIRALNNPVLNTGNPSTIKDFFWLVLRSGYSTAPAFPNSEQAGEYLKLFIGNFSWLWVLAFAGVYAFWIKNKKALYAYSALFAVIVFMVVFFNRFDDRPQWAINVFFLPALYIVTIFIISGICYLFMSIKNKGQQQIFLIAAFVIVLYMGFTNFNKNNSRYDFQAYDFGANILKTTEPNSLYLCEGDFYIMPVQYFQIIENERPDVKLGVVNFLAFRWGLSEFLGTNMDIPVREFDLKYSLPNIIDHYKYQASVYKSPFSPIFDGLQLSYGFNQNGLLGEYSNTSHSNKPYYFKIYSYNRDSFNKYIKYNPANLHLVALYVQSMMTQANQAFEFKKPLDAIDLYKRVLLYPYEIVVAEEVYFNMAQAYKILPDKEMELQCLVKAMEINNQFLPAFEQAGILLFDRKDFIQAKNVMERAIQLGSLKRQEFDNYIGVINNKP